MYHVIGTGLTILLLYLLSFVLYKNNFYSLQFHRKFWNILLALAFITTALAGVFLALQINYKWNIPAIRQILKWHVETGISLSITGLIHFFCHFSYFTDIFKKKDIPSVKITEPAEGLAGMATNLFIIGLISTSVQLLLLKEIINISGGYELIAGTFLASWLICSAAGSLMAGRSGLSDIRKINVFFFAGPVISICLLLLLSRLFLESGETPSFLTSLIFTLFAVAPFCFISGFAFIRLTSMAVRFNDVVPGKSFSLETAGGIAAGILVAVLSAAEMNTYQTILLIVVLGISYVILSYYLKGKKEKLIFKVTILGISSFLIITNPDVMFRQILLRGINVTGSKDTPYGNVTRGEYRGEESIYYDQRLVSYNDDSAEREEDIHYTMLQSDKPENILMISGNLDSHLREIVKYPVKKVVYVERDPELIRIRRQQETSGPNELLIENNDGFTWIKNTSEKFDVVISLLPPPSSLLLNRYYTLEFFKAIKGTLNSGGVFSCSPGTYSGYFNEEYVELSSSIYNSMKAVFKNVLPIPGNKLYFIGSDKDISTSICRLVQVKGLKNTYIGPDYLSDDLISAKSAEITSLLDKSEELNRSAFPVACFFYQSYNLSKNLNEKIPVIGILIILFLLPMASVKRSNLMMYFSASALAGYEIILLLLLQLTIGNMYQYTGLIIAGLMAGLATGSLLRIKDRGRVSVLLKAILLIIFYTIMGSSVTGILNLKGNIIISGLLIVSGFIPAVVTGNLYRELTIREKAGTNISKTYYADLAGSAMGFIVFSGVVVPLYGIKFALFLFPVLIFAGYLFSSLRTER